MARQTFVSKSFVDPLQLYNSSTKPFKEALYQIPFKERRDLLESLSVEIPSVESFVEWCNQNYPDTESSTNENKAPTRRSKKTKQTTLES